jgi:hypothetical protein
VAIDKALLLAHYPIFIKSEAAGSSPNLPAKINARISNYELRMKKDVL